MDNIAQVLALIEKCKEEGGDLNTLASAFQALSAAGKTSLGLNQWASTDKPLMTDFNRDNEIIDGEIQALKANKVNMGPPQEYDLPFVSGISNYHDSASKYNKNAFNQVSGYIRATASVTLTGGTTIAVMPEGFRPKAKVAAVAYYKPQASNATYAMHVECNTDGSLKLMHPSMPSGLLDLLVCQFWYPAAQ